MSFCANLYRLRNLVTKHGVCFFLLKIFGHSRLSSPSAESSKCFFCIVTFDWSRHFVTWFPKTIYTAIFLSFSWAVVFVTITHYSSVPWNYYRPLRPMNCYILLRQLLQLLYSSSAQSAYPTDIYYFSQNLTMSKHYERHITTNEEVNNSELTIVYHSPPT